MSRKVQMAAAGGAAPPAPRPHVPRTVADHQNTGEVMLPGTLEYEELATQLKAGEITAEQFVERINQAVEKA
jgi:hypothetical protein